MDDGGGKEVHYWDRRRRRGLEWYSQLFADASRVNGDMTPAYGILPVEIIREIHDSFPHLRLIYMIRNPIERAWSAARMALRRAEMLHAEASDQWFIDHFNSRGSLARGDYEACIRRWRGVFPPGQLLIVRYEQVGEDPVAVANSCLNHVGVERVFTSSHRDELAQRVFEGDDVRLRPALREVLSDIYARKIESLESYLGEDFSGWR